MDLTAKPQPHAEYFKGFIFKRVRQYVQRPDEERGTGPYLQGSFTQIQRKALM